MKRTELTAELRDDYREDRGFGVEKGLSPNHSTWFVVPPPPPTARPRGLTLEKLGAAHRALDQLPSFDALTSLDRSVLNLLAKQEAVASSRMEGTWSTIDHALTPGDIYNRGEKSASQSVRDYAAALDEVFEVVSVKGVEAIDRDLVRRLHRAITVKDPDYRGVPGQFRDEAEPGKYVWIGGSGRIEDSIYNPVPPGHLARKLDELIGWMKDDVIREMGDAGQGLSLFMRMVIAHVHFEALHPFSDGNGRVGRMLMAMQMVAEGKAPLYLAAYIEQHKSEYISGLTQAQKKLNYEPMITFMSEAFVVSWDEAQLSKHALVALPEMWRARAKFRARSTAERVLERLLSNPILTATTLQNMLSVSAPAANAALKALVQARVLRERTGLGRNRIFAAEEVISILSRPLHEHPEIARKSAFALMKSSSMPPSV